MPNNYVAENEKGKALRTVKIVVNVIRYSESDGVKLVTFRTRREFKEKWTIASSAIMKGQIAEHTYASPHPESTYEARLNKMFDILQLPFPR